MKQRRVGGWIWLLGCALLSAASASRAQSPSVEAKRDAARIERAGAAQPDQASHPDAQARKALEHAPTTRSADAALLPPGTRVTSLPDPNWRRQALDSYEWDAAFAAGGPRVGGLQLALGGRGEAYQPGVGYRLYFGLRNWTRSRRGLHLSACGSLSRADGIWFRVVSDTGRQVLTQLVYKDTDDEHVHGSLTLDGQSSLRDLVDLSHLAATSGELSDLLLKASRVEVSAEIPSLGLTSNPVDIGVVAPLGTH